MTNYLPYPANLCQWSASRAAERNKAKRSKHDTEYQGLCYELPNGELRMTHDPYRPEYPEGSRPGIGRIRQRRHFYPNDSHGYSYEVLNFRPLDPAQPTE